MKNYYEILGLTEKASQEDIKKAYKKLAKQYHPDMSTGDETKFKEIQEAYDTLGDEQKRAQYDQQRNGNPFAAGAGNPFSDEAHTRDAFEDIFARFGNMGHGMNDLNEFFKGHKKNKDLVAKYDVTLKEAFWGKQARIELQDGTSVSFIVPPGIENGSRVRLKGYGRTDNTNLPPGDLYVEVHITTNEGYWRNQNDLHKRVDIDCFDAILGTAINVHTICDKTVKVNVKPGTQTNTKYRLSGYGMPKGQGRGDMFVEVIVRTPTDLTEEQIKMVKQIKDLD